MAKAGRHPAIPQEFVEAITQRHKSGEGFRLLSRWLRERDIDASPAACRRAVLGLPPYSNGSGLPRPKVAMATPNSPAISFRPML